MTNAIAKVDAFEKLPLCGRYLSVHFEAQEVLVPPEDGSAKRLILTWAAGALPGGEWEVLGVWPAPAGGSTFWRGVFDELQVRGVEQISVLSVDEPAGLLSDHACSTMMTKLKRTYAVKSQHRRVLCAMDGTVIQLKQRVNRAVTRHGRFADPAAAISFVLDTLTRAERDLGADGVEAFAPRHPAARASGTLRTETTGI